MEDATTTYTLRRKSFPSDSFLQTYFGEGTIVAGNPHRGEINTSVYTLIRDEFDLVLLTGPVYMLKDQNRSGEEFQSIYIFKDSQPTPWVLEQLADRCIAMNPDSEMSQALCAECIVLQALAPPPHSWWQWQVSSDSVWIEVIPEAIAAGKNKRRTLSEVLKET